MRHLARASSVGLAVGSGVLLSLAMLWSPRPGTPAQAAVLTPATHDEALGWQAPAYSTPAAAGQQIAEGEWTLTGGLHETRPGSTATLLPDGRVLVVGGWTGGQALIATASAELYDPRSGTWTLTGSLQEARQDHTATLLADGRVLVAGGYRYPETIAPAEIYDPKTEAWTLTGSLQEARYDHTATLLADGRVLVAGGSHYAGLYTAELYDPQSGTWTFTAPLAWGNRFGHTANLLPDGRVLVVGGERWNNAYPLALPVAELYDPRSETWAQTASMHLNRRYHTATSLPDGRVLVVGGYGNDQGPWGAPDCNPAASAEIYDSRHESWTLTGNIHHVRNRHSATLLADGRVLVAGGHGPNCAITATSELYDPRSGTWTLTGSLQEARASHLASRLADGRVLVAGGAYHTGDLVSAELYDPATTIPNTALPAQPGTDILVLPLVSLILLLTLIAGPIHRGLSRGGQ